MKIIGGVAHNTDGILQFFQKKIIGISYL